MFFQQLLNGLTIGGVYSLVALGLTLVYGILHVPNFAHGALYMAGAFVAFYFMESLGLNYWLAMLGSALVVAVLSMLAERLVFHKLRNAPPLHDMIAAIGILLFLEAGAQAIWGADFHRMQSPYGGLVEIFGLTTVAQRLLIIAGAVVLVAVAIHRQKRLILLKSSQFILSPAIMLSGSNRVLALKLRRYDWVCSLCWQG